MVPSQSAARVRGPLALCLAALLVGACGSSSSDPAPGDGQTPGPDGVESTMPDTDAGASNSDAPATPGTDRPSEAIVTATPIVPEIAEVGPSLTGGVGPSVEPVVEQRDADVAALGRRIFEDVSLAEPATVSCATCHEPTAGFADPRGGPVSAGAVEGLFGNRNAPSVAYAAFVPPLTLVDITEGDGETEVDYIGGLFWDGRADTLEIQALSPIRNHLEENSSGDAAIVRALAAADYAPEIERLFGAGVLDDQSATLVALSDALAAFERSAEVNPFSSRYDRFLRGEDTLSEEEALGLALFEDEEKGNCAACHVTTPAFDGGPVLFTDQTYDNLGIPKNEANPFLDLPPAENPDGRAFVDFGLFATTGRPEDAGRFRVPTLRNVELTAPYGHNGFFATLEDMVRFYNVKNDGSFGAPEVPATENREEVGALGLTADEEAAIVAFLKTLTDEPADVASTGR